MITPGQARDVLNALRDKKPRRFSSHDFIEEYCKQFETPYIDWLVLYRGTGRAFWQVHTEIGTFLSEQEGRIAPYYHRIGRRTSENVHGENDKPMWWEWMKSEW